MTSGQTTTDGNSVRVRMLGRLHTLRKRQGLEPEARVAVPCGGIPAADLARLLDLLLDQIESVFCNHRAHHLAHIVRPGDAVAFVPRGTPGPHRYCLGIYHSGTETPPT